MHEHNECEHDLKHCRKCDVIYCVKCKREWGGHNHYYYWPYYDWPYYYPYTTPTITWGTTTYTADETATATYTACSHTN